MSKETKHLIKWWLEWLCRLITTSWHLFNRKAYHRWKARRRQTNSVWPAELEALDADLFH